MSDYRPTTQEVRTSYGAAVTFPTMSLPERRRAFDRWLEQVKAEAWDEGRRSGFETGITIAEVVAGTKPPPYPEPEPNPHRQETNS